MQPVRFNPITGCYVIELVGGTGKVETKRWRLGTLFMLVFSVFHLTSPMVALSQTSFGPGPMTVTGSTGTVDEDSLNQYEVRNQFATIKNSVPSATVTYRYNLVPVFNFSNFFCGCPYDLRIRYRDTGANQNVKVRLRAANTEVDGVTTIYEFDSDAADTFAQLPPPNVNANQTVDKCSVIFPPPHVIHGTYVYFLEVVVTKTANDNTQSPGFIAFVIGSSGGCAPPV